MNEIIYKIVRRAYKYYFLLLAVGVILISLGIFIVNNLSELPVLRIHEQGTANAAEISEILMTIKQDFSYFVNLTEELNDNETDESVRLKNISVTFKKFVENHYGTEGYFFNILSDTPTANHEVYWDGEKTFHISILMEKYLIDHANKRLASNGEPYWITCYNPLTSKANMAYIIPVYNQTEYAGFAGIILKLDYLKEEMISKFNSPYAHAGLFTEYLEALLFKDSQPGIMLSDIGAGQYRDLYKKIESEKNGYSVINENGRAWIYSFTQLESGQIFVYACERFGYLRDVNTLIISCALFAATCLMFVQGIGKNNLSAFDRLAARVMKNFEKQLHPLRRVGTKAAFAVQAVIIAQLLAYLVFNIAIRAPLDTILMYGVWLTVAVTIIIFHIKNGTVARNSIRYSIVLIVVPLGLHIWFGGFNGVGSGEIIIWMISGVMLCIFLSSTAYSRLLFGFFVILLFIDALIEVYVLRSSDYSRIFFFITSQFFLGFAIFISQQLYVSRSWQLYNELDKLHKKLLEAQASLIHEEKMVSLGRLSAGITHEINTPIGAIKASAQTMSSMLDKTLEGLLQSGKTISEDDYPVFLRLVSLLVHSSEQMYSTLQIRRARPIITEYINSLDIENKPVVLQKILRLEFCEIETLKENEDIWTHPDASTILTLACDIAPIVTGINVIISASGNVSRIISALKTYAHTSSSGRRSKFDLSKSIDNVLILYHNQIKGVVETVKNYDAVPEMFANWDELGQIWTNLIQNALYAMDNSGTLSITITNTNDGYALIKFKDTGPGIDEKDAGKIFDPFFTTKPLGEGTGIGLNLSQKIIANHRGTISYESKKGEGTEFTVRLPVVTDESNENSLLEGDMRNAFSYDLRG